MAHFNERFASIEGQTTRLYIRNYVSNVLTNADSVSVLIRAQGGTTTLASNLPVVQDGVGTYYVDYAVPSSDIESPKYNPDFPGPGFYQDVWTLEIGNNNFINFAQDFFVFSQEQLQQEQSIVQPLRFEYTLQPTRLERGARDFLSVFLTERNGVLVPEEDVFPEGEVQLFFNNQVIFNYRDMNHSVTDNEYTFFLDTTELRSGVYSVQTRHEVPAGVVNSQASLLSTVSLSNGFTPSSTALLQLEAEGINRTIAFPSTATSAEVTTTFSELPSLFQTSNDLFIVDVDSVTRERRLLHGVNGRLIDDIIDELNGTFPVAAFGSPTPTTSLPAITSAIDISATEVNDVRGRELIFNVDGLFTTVQFSNTVTTIGDLETEITSAGINAYADGSRLIIAPSSADSVEVVGGSAATILGFANNQGDGSKFGLKVNSGDDDVAVKGLLIEATTTNTDGTLIDLRLETSPDNNIQFTFGSNVDIGGDAKESLANLRDAINNHPDRYYDAILNSDGDKLSIVSVDRLPMLLTTPISPSPTVFDWTLSNNINILGSESVRIQSPSEGSTANDALGFLASGESADAVAASASNISGTNVFPIVSLNPTSGSVVSNILSSFDGTTLGGKDLGIKVDGQSPAQTISFTDTLNPAAITSLALAGNFDVNGLTLIVTYDDNTISPAKTNTVTFSGTDPFTLNQIVSQINNGFATATLSNDNISSEVVADQFNGRLRIRARNVVGSLSTDVTLEIDETSTAYTVLGFNGVESDPEGVYQNDQVTLTGGMLTANNYIVPFTTSSIITAINDSLVGAIASLAGDEILITSNTTGTGSSIEIIDYSPNQAEYDLGLSGSGTGSNGSNYDLSITVSGIPSPAETITFTDGANTAADIVAAINDQSSIVTSSVNTNGGVLISAIDRGANKPLNITTSVGNISYLGFDSSLDGIDIENGNDAIPAIVFTTSAPDTEYVSLGNAILKIRENLDDDFTEIDITASSPLDGSSIAADINAASTLSKLTASYSGSLLRILDVRSGEDSYIEIGAFNDGSNANPSINISLDGVVSNGTEGVPYTLDNIVERINAAFGGEAVSEVSGNFLRLQSITSGASASITVGNATTSDIISGWGITKGTVFGVSRTQSAQTIVSPKLNLVVGD